MMVALVSVAVGDIRYVAAETDENKLFAMTAQSMNSFFMIWVCCSLLVIDKSTK